MTCSHLSDHSLLLIIFVDFVKFRFRPSTLHHYLWLDLPQIYESIALLDKNILTFSWKIYMCWWYCWRETQQWTHLFEFMKCLSFSFHKCIGFIRFFLWRHLYLIKYACNLVETSDGDWWGSIFENVSASWKLLKDWSEGMLLFFIFLFFLWCK